MKAEKYLSEGGAQALMIISGVVLLILLVASPIATSCGGFASVILVLLPRMMGPGYKAQKGFGLVAGLPVIVGFFAQPGVFFVTAMFTWFLLVGLADSGAVERTKDKVKH